MDNKEGKVDTPKSRAERIQILLIMAMGIILPSGFHALMHRAFHAASDVIIFITTMIIPLTIVILIERKKPHSKFIAQ